MTRDPNSRSDQSDLDKTLADTFPASDPPAPHLEAKGPTRAEQAALDEALEETFPASDPLPANPGVSRPPNRPA